MAEKKISDVWIGIIILGFFLVSFGAVIISMDGEFSNSEGYGDNISNIGSSVDTKYKDLEVDVRTNDEGSSQTLPSGTDVDVRGSSQVNILKKQSPDTISTFINASAKYIGFHPYITAMLISMVISIIIILGIRFWKPGGI